MSGSKYVYEIDMTNRNYTDAIVIFHCGCQKNNVILNRRYSWKLIWCVSRTNAKLKTNTVTRRGTLSYFTFFSNILERRIIIKYTGTADIKTLFIELRDRDIITDAWQDWTCHELTKTREFDKYMLKCNRRGIRALFLRAQSQKYLITVRMFFRKKISILLFLIL